MAEVQRHFLASAPSVDAGAEAGLHGPKPRRSAFERNVASAPPPLGLSPANAFGGCPEQIANQRGRVSRSKAPKTLGPRFKVEI
jgi:hypothetical protein